MSDKVVSYLRTFVPIWWGTAISWALANFTGLADFLHSIGIDPTSVAVVSGVTAIAIALWYALWRWLEPRLPDWLTRIVLGSAKAPAYAGTPGDGKAVVAVPETQPADTEFDDLDTSNDGPE